MRPHTHTDRVIKYASTYHAVIRQCIFLLFIMISLTLTLSDMRLYWYKYIFNRSETCKTNVHLTRLHWIFKREDIKITDNTNEHKGNLDAQSMFKQYSKIAYVTTWKSPMWRYISKFPRVQPIQMKQLPCVKQHVLG